MTEQQVNHFHTLGFLQCRQFITPEETEAISKAFDAAMKKGRGGAEEPELTQDDHGNSKVRQQINSTIPPNLPFFDLDPDAFYPLLEDERFDDVFRTLLGDDYIVSVSEGIIHAGGSGWHHDNVAPEGYFTMRAHMYLDKLGPNDGCLSVIPGSHHTPFRDALGTDDNGMSVRAIGRMGIPPEKIPGRYDLVNEPGDVVFLNHKCYHSALSGRSKRRCLHINAGKAAHTESHEELVAALENHMKSPHEEVRRTAANSLKRLTARAS